MCSRICEITKNPNRRRCSFVKFSSVKIRVGGNGLKSNRAWSLPLIGPTLSTAFFGLYRHETSRNQGSCSRKEERWPSEWGWSLIHWFWNQIYTICHNTSCATWKLFLSFVTCATSSVWFFSNILWSASQAKPTTSGLASIPLITWLMQSVTWAMLRTQICNWIIFLQSIILTHSSRLNTLWLQYFYVDLSAYLTSSFPPYEISGSSITGRNFSSARILRRTSSQSWTVSTR